MLLAAVYLICWDYDRWKSLLFAKRRFRPRLSHREFLILPLLFSFAATIGAAFLANFAVANLNRNFVYKASIIAVGGFVFGLVCSLHHKFMRSGELEDAAGMP
jgi:hypothetical protein